MIRGRDPSTLVRRTLAIYRDSTGSGQPAQAARRSFIAFAPEHGSPEELVAEIRGAVDAVVAMLEGNDRPALVWNVAVHHADLHEALGPSALPARLWRPVVDSSRDDDQPVREN